MHTLTKKLVLPMLGLLALGITAPTAAGTWIVELDDPPAAHWLAEQGLTVHEVDADLLELYRNDLAATQDAFLDALAASGIPAEPAALTALDLDGQEHRIESRYTLVYNGLALEMDAAFVDEVAAMDGVKAVHREEILHTTLDASVEYVRATEVFGSLPALGPWDQLSDGLEGQGVHVSIIDTGIEWAHEMFGGDPSAPRFGLAPPTAAVGSNEKVIYQLSFAGSPIDDFGHGTHVAATAAGYLGFGRESLVAEEQEVHGVAPQGRLMDYKVCTANGSCLGQAIIMAIEDSASPRTLTGFPKPVAHVINMSLGGAGGPDSPNAVAADNAALAGVIVVSSAGNSGPEKGTIGQPSAGRHVISIGANNDPSPGPSSIEVLTDERSRFLADFAADSNLGLPMDQPLQGNYVDAGLADTPDQVPPTVLGNICLAERGSTIDAEEAGTGVFANKVAQCESKGAIATVIFNNEPGRPGPILAPGSRPVYSISREAGLLLRDELEFDATGVSVYEIVLDLPDLELFAPEMAGFSSRGPVQGLGQIQPDVTAPGVAILAATSPFGAPAASMQSETRYIRASGTSMSGPHVAGAAALLRQARPGWSPDLIRTALINTGTNLRDVDGQPKPDGLEADDVLSQGGGLIDVFRAVNTPALMGVLSTPPVTNQDAPGLLGSHSFGAVAVVNSRVSHSESIDVTLLDVAGEAGDWQLSVVNNRDLQLDGIEVDLSSDNVSLEAGGNAEFTVRLTFDGDKLREPVPMVDSRTGATVAEFDTQWYVVAERIQDGGSIRMPFHLRPIDSVPAGPVPAAPLLNPIEGDFVQADGTPVSFDGSFELVWEGDANALGYEVERAVDGGDFETFAEVDANTTSLALDEQPDGRSAFRVRALSEGEIGFFVGDPGNVEEILVDRREQIDITAVVSSAIDNVDQSGDEFSFDLRLTNDSDGTFVPLVEFNIIGINSSSGTQEVINADNEGSGTSPDDPALFDYSHSLGDDEQFNPGETTGPRRLEFQNEARELFFFDAIVTAYQRTGGDSAAATDGDAGFEGNAASSGDDSVESESAVLRFEVDPLTGTVTVRLLDLLDDLDDIL